MKITKAKVISFLIIGSSIAILVLGLFFGLGKKTKTKPTPPHDPGINGVPVTRGKPCSPTLLFPGKKRTLTFTTFNQSYFRVSYMNFNGQYSNFVNSNSNRTATVNDFLDATKIKDSRVKTNTLLGITNISQTDSADPNNKTYNHTWECNFRFTVPDKNFNPSDTTSRPMPTTTNGIYIVKYSTFSKILYLTVSFYADSKYIGQAMIPETKS